MVRGITVRGGNEIHLSRAVVEDGEVSKEREIFLLRFFSLSFEYRIIDRFAIIRGKRKKRKNLETRMHGALMKYLIAGGGKGEGRGGVKILFHGKNWGGARKNYVARKVCRDRS